MNSYKSFFLTFLFSMISIVAYTQYLSCEEAGMESNILCSLGELDDFSSTMPSSNTFDEPAPLCASTGGNPQNMSWFAFIAGSANAVLELTTSNCNSGSSIQYGVYEDCTYSNSIICQGSPQNANSTITLNLTGMIPGDDYYFFIDGDLGTYCDYEIDVISGGAPIPVPQPTGINCISSNCPPDNAVCLSNDTYTFEAEGLDLTIDYLWSITPLPAGYPPNPQTINGINTIDLTFSTADDYMVCLEATNGCTTTDEICIDFTVFESDAGNLTATPNPLCPGEISTVTVTGYTMSSIASEKLIVVDPNGVITDISEPPTIDITYDQCGTITVYSYNYITNNNPGVPTIGSNYNAPDCNTFCCDTESIEIVFEDDENPTFVDPPTDITMDCNNSIPVLEDLSWNDNCSGTGTVMGSEIQDYNTCNGGTITRTWTYTDVCNNSVEHIQTITLNPAPSPIFIDPPANETLNCDQVPGSIPTLSVSNNQTGACLIEGTVNGTETSNYTTCNGGTTTRTWSFTDVCGNTIEFVQTITINPAPEASFIDPPMNITINCDEVAATYPSLDLSNNQSGACLIEGSIAPTVTGNPGTCGGNIDIYWVFTDECGRIASHLQIITVLAAAPPQFIDPPADLNLSCGEAIPSSIDLDYQNGESGACLIEGTISPSIDNNTNDCGGTIIYTWEFTDNCNQTISHSQTIVIDPPSEPSYIDPPADETISCDQVPVNPVDLSYDNGDSGTCQIIGTSSPSVDDNADICGGTISNVWEFIDDCNRVINHTQTITVEPAPEPVFIDPPANITIDCDAVTPSPPILLYSNNVVGDCEISGSIQAIIQDNSNSCGGNIVYTWEYTDPCSRTITHIQTITITEAPQASFIDLPMDESYNCSEIINPAQALAYSNNDDCSIIGNVDPSILDNTDICGGTITNTWDFTDECGRNINHIQIITKEPTPQATFTNPPINTTVNCGDTGINPIDLDYSNGENAPCEISGSISPSQTGSYDACGGQIVFTWEHTDQCNRTLQHIQTILVEPASQASFTNPPSDITVSCTDYNINPPSLDYSNGEADLCEISGQVIGTIIGTPNPCGTTVKYRWEFTDDCGRTITHIQNITIEEATQANFTNPPSDITLDCNNVPNVVPTLNYHNNASGICAISGSINGIQSGSYDECGGSITYSWTFTDQCNRVITHNQTITINPASDPQFINPPNDITLGCNESFPINPTLDYSNSEVGNCAISGTIIAMTTTNGPINTYTWEFTNTCNGNIITHSQNIISIPTPDITISPIQTNICLGSDFDLSTIIVSNQNGNNITISYLDGNGNIVVNPIVSPLLTTSYTIIATNNDGCTDNATFTIDIDTPPNAGEDGTAKICDANQTYNLFDYLNGLFDANGTWYDTDNSGANIDNPIMTDFSGVGAGFYNFTYTVFSTNSCDDVSAIVTIEFIEELDIQILMIECEPNGVTYHINVFTDGNNIISTSGDVTVIDATNVLISNIPSGQSVVVSGFDAEGLCNTNINVNAPDCDCPEVPSPTGEDQSICEEEDIPTLLVTINSGFKANWYDSPTDGNLLISNNTKYTPISTIPGIYTFYVESEDNNGCISLIRTPIKLTIKALPVLNSISVEICPNENGNIQTVLSDLNLQIHNNANFTFIYYPSLIDAQNNSNPLDDNYSTGSTTTIFVSVKNTSDCIAYQELNIIKSELPNYELVITNESCTNEKDGRIFINNITPNNTSFSLDGVTYEAVSSFDTLEPGNYILYAKTINDCIKSENFTIEDGLTLSYTDLVISCNDNETNTNSSDDYYNISFILNNNQSLVDNVNISIPGQDFGMLSFGEISIEIPVGTAQTITIMHPITGCNIEIATGELTPCSSSCSITIDNLDLECDGNNTDADPSDDIYQITINASVINGASNNSFNVLIDGNIIDNFQYGTGGVISIPAQGQTVNISIVDNEDSQCFSSQILGPLTPCSNTCILNIDNQNFICDNQGTIGISSDDTYNFSFQILATNSTSTNFFLFIDGTNVGTYDYNTNSNINIPADGITHNIIFVDSVDPDCKVTLISPKLESCSGSCSVNTTLQVTYCDNNNTADDESDDTFTVDVKIDLIGGSGKWQIISSNQSGVSGQIITLGPFLITNGNINIEINDSEISTCKTTVELIAPPSCSSCEGWVNAGSDVELDCDIREATLVGTSSSTGNSLWTGPGSFSEEAETIIVEIAGIYIYTVNLGDNCIKKDTVIVNVSNDIPNANAGANKSITCLQDSVILEGTVIGGSGNFDYKWLDIDMVVLTTNQVLKVGTSGFYYFVVYDKSTDCTSPTSVVEVMDHTQNPSAIIYANPANVLDCVVELIYLTNDNQPNIEYIWYVNNIITNNDKITIDDAALIKLVAIDTLSGCEAESELNIPNLEVYPFISVIEPEEFTCNKTNITLDASQSQAGANISYTWTNENNTILAVDVNSIEVMEAGTYYIDLIDVNNNCTNRDTIIVSGTTDIFEIDLTTSISSSPGEIIQLDAIVNINPMDIDNIQWSPKENLSCDTCLVTDLLVGTNNQIYTVHIIDINGCEAEAQINVLSIDKIIITIPNIFNPTSEFEENQNFTIYTTDENALIKEFTVYDRWGNQLFSKNNVPVNQPNLGWDGRYKSTLVQPGVYVFFTIITLSNGDQITKSGDVTIIR